MRQTAALARVSPYRLLTATILFWSLNWIVGRALRDDVPSYSLAFWRWVSASALLLPFAWPHLARGWPAMIVGGIWLTSRADNPEAEAGMEN